MVVVDVGILRPRKNNIIVRVAQEVDTPTSLKGGESRTLHLVVNRDHLDAHSTPEARAVSAHTHVGLPEEEVGPIYSWLCHGVILSSRRSERAMLSSRGDLPGET